MRLLATVICIGCLWYPIPGYTIDMAITIDDLPIHGPLPAGDSRREISRRMIATLKAKRVPDAYGFVNGRGVDGVDTLGILEDWAAAGLQLGNHTFSHPYFNKLTVEEYVEDIRKNEPLLASLASPANFKLFRYPFLREGDTREKREGVRRFLAENGYTIAQVTVNFDDWAWSNPYERCLSKADEKALAFLRTSFMEHASTRLALARELSQLVLGREIRHVLLLHIGAFTEVMLKDLLDLYASKGARYVSLKSALSDAAYAVDSGYVGETGTTFLDQLLLMKKLPYPKVPAIPVKQLKALCQ